MRYRLMCGLMHGTVHRQSREPHQIQIYSQRQIIYQICPALQCPPLNQITSPPLQHRIEIILVILIVRTVSSTIPGQVIFIFPFFFSFRFNFIQFSISPTTLIRGILFLVIPLFSIYSCFRPYSHFIIIIFFICKLHF